MNSIQTSKYIRWYIKHRDWFHLNLEDENEIDFWVEVDGKILQHENKSPFCTMGFGGILLSCTVRGEIPRPTYSSVMWIWNTWKCLPSSRHFPSGCVFLILREIILYVIFDATIRGNRTYLFPISSSWNQINPDIKTVWCGSEIKSWAWRNAPLICIMDCVLGSHLENWYLQECKDLYLSKKQGFHRYSREFILTVQTQEENNA